MIASMRPTSKIGLKQMCLMSANGDLEKANKIYEYMIKDLDDLPVSDPVIPSRAAQVKNGVSETFNWLNENQNQILLWVDLVLGLVRGKNIRTNTTDINTLQQDVMQPLPPINQQNNNER